MTAIGGVRGMETRRSRRKAREEFFALHPHCIFCGGGTSATTWDHVPSRQMFHEKGWPEGYVFPACASCNTATSGDEQVVALMARVYPDGPTPAHEQELNELIEAVRNNRPRVLIEMQPSRRQVRQANSAPWASSYRADGQPPPVLSFGGPLMRQSLKAFARKLFCALHYKEFGEIIPREGCIAWRWYSNIQGLEGKLPDELTVLMQLAPKGTRANRDLSDQFSYAFVKAGDSDLAGYYAIFRLSFAMLGVVSANGSPFEFVNESELLKPLAPKR
jgi:hypothetical protein